MKSFRNKNHHACSVLEVKSQGLLGRGIKWLLPHFPSYSSRNLKTSREVSPSMAPEEHDTWPSTLYSIEKVGGPGGRMKWIGNKFAKLKGWESWEEAKKVGKTWVEAISEALATRWAAGVSWRPGRTQI